MEMDRAYFKKPDDAIEKDALQCNQQAGRKTQRDVEKIGKQRIWTSRQNLVYSLKNCDQEDRMEHTHSRPMLQIGVRGDNGIDVLSTADESHSVG